MNNRKICKHAAARRARAEKNTRPRAADRRHKTPQNTGARERQPAADAQKYAGTARIKGAHTRRGRRKHAGAAGIMGAHARRGGRKYAGAGGRAHAEKCESRWSRANGNIQVSERGRGGRVTFWR